MLQSTALAIRVSGFSAGKSLLERQIMRDAEARRSYPELSRQDARNPMLPIPRDRAGGETPKQEPLGGRADEMAHWSSRSVHAQIRTVDMSALSQMEGQTKVCRFDSYRWRSNFETRSNRHRTGWRRPPRRLGNSMEGIVIDLCRIGSRYLQISDICDNHFRSSYGRL